MRASIIGLAAALLCVDGLNNGVGRTPALGFSSWNAFSADVNSATMRQIVNLMISSGLAAKNFTYVNIDEARTTSFPYFHVNSRRSDLLY